MHEIKAGPDRYWCVGALVELPRAVLPMAVSGFPRRGRPGPRGHSGLVNLPPIPPGTPLQEAFSIRFWSAGDPTSLGVLLEPAVIDGFLRAPPGVHVELWDRWMLSVAYAPFVPAVGTTPISVLLRWLIWFATLLPLDRLPEATPVVSPAVDASRPPPPS